MPVNPAPAPPPVAVIPHFRKLAFAGGAILTALVLFFLQTAMS
jgi:hypothetical protein